ncbi:hypothetical protein E4U17_003742 [Claviceps sp. LM77 group G4]|nr:hypothetical protein E4U17_003742 [Claviceps sp. LM77 group G4]
MQLLSAILVVATASVASAAVASPNLDDRGLNGPYCDRGSADGGVCEASGLHGYCNTVMHAYGPWKSADTPAHTVHEEAYPRLRLLARRYRSGNSYRVWEQRRQNLLWPLRVGHLEASRFYFSPSRSLCDLETWLVATWRPGDLATWRPGDLAT